MNKDNLKVYVNKSYTGDIFLENENYAFNYDFMAQNVVSLTMPIRNSSWLSKKLHPIQFI